MIFDLDVVDRNRILEILNKLFLILNFYFGCFLENIIEIIKRKSDLKFEEVLVERGFKDLYKYDVLFNFLLFRIVIF